MTEDQVEQIQLWIDDNCTMTLESMKEKILEELGLNVSLATVHRYVVSFHYTYKRLHVIVEKGETEANWNERRLFSLWLMQMNATNRKLIFLYEVGFNFTMRTHWKNLTKRAESNNEQELIQIIHRINEIITADHCSNYFRHCAENAVKILDNHREGLE